MIKIEYYDSGRVFFAEFDFEKNNHVLLINGVNNKLAYTQNADQISGVVDPAAYKSLIKKAMKP